MRYQDETLTIKIKRGQAGRLLALMAAGLTHNITGPEFSELFDIITQQVREHDAKKHPEWRPDHAD